MCGAACDKRRRAMGAFRGVAALWPFGSNANVDFDLTPYERIARTKGREETI